MRKAAFATLGLLLVCPAGLAEGPQRGGRGGRPAPPPRIVTFEARPASIEPGESALLVWHVENPSGLTLEPGIGAVIPRGSVEVTPAATTTYTLSLPGAGDTPLTRSLTVTVTGTTPATVASPTDDAEEETEIPRTRAGQPDFSGVYSFRSGRGVAAGDGPTLRPGAEGYRVERDPLDTGATSDCMPLIPPNAFGVPYQFQIMQNDHYLAIFHEYPGTFRIIPLDGQRVQVEPDPSWLGDPAGQWEGDTLVVETIGYNDKTEISGYRHTEALRTVERLTRVENGFEYAITIEDPNVFVEPWTQQRTFQFNVPPMKRVMEFVCENNRDYRPLFGSTIDPANR